MKKFIKLESINLKKKVRKILKNIILLRIFLYFR